MHQFPKENVSEEDKQVCYCLVKAFEQFSSVFLSVMTTGYKETKSAALTRRQFAKVGFLCIQSAKEVTHAKCRQEILKCVCLCVHVKEIQRDTKR